MIDILLTEHQCSLPQQSMHAPQADIWHQVWLAHASLGFMYGRPSVTECDMHYARSSVIECEYYAYMLIKPHVMTVGGGGMWGQLNQKLCH